MVGSGAGKGDTPRPVDSERYSKNYDAIFGKKKLNNMEDHDAEDKGDSTPRHTRTKS